MADAAADTMPSSLREAQTDLVQARRHTTILQVQWALSIACAYLVLFSEQAAWTAGGALVIAVFLATNLVVGRTRPEAVAKPAFRMAIAIIDTILITASLYVASQLSVQLVMLCLGVLILVVAGLRIELIAAATLLMTVAYLAIVWSTSSETIWQPGVLMRVPLLFTAAIVFSWLVGIGTRNHSATAQQSADGGAELAGQLNAQLDAIHRCQSAVRNGSKEIVEKALGEIAAQNESLQARLRA